MSAFTDLEDQIKRASAGGGTGVPAARNVRLTPGDFSPTWHNAPSSDVVVGIRVYSESDARTAEQEAAKQEDQVAAEQVLFSLAVARGICDPNNVKAPHPLFPFADDTIPLALTPRAVRRLFDEIERLHVDQSPAFAEATDDDLVELAGALIQPDPLGKLDAVKAKRARRYVRLALDLLNESNG
jgi:hypothetical protein